MVHFIGYLSVFSNELIIQWGIVELGNITITFPINFKSFCIIIVTVKDGNSSTNITGTYYDETLSNFFLKTTYSDQWNACVYTGLPANWISIGF